MTNFRTFFFKTLRTPKRFSGTYGRLLWAGIALVHDAIAEGAMFAQAASLIQRAPDDALDVIGWERMIIRGIAESYADYRLRLQNAWETWSNAGTPTAIMGQLDPQFGGTGVLVESREPEGGTLAFPWSWFYVYYDIGEHPLTVLDFGNENATRDIVNRWKDAGTVCRCVALILRGRIFGIKDNYTFGDADTDGLLFGDSDALQIFG